MKKLITKSVLAGLLIAVAGAIFLRCDNKIIGSALFSIGLIGVILLEANLFTGKVGYANKHNLLSILLMLLINLFVAFIVGLLFRCCVGMSGAMTTRLAKTWYQLLWDGMICGTCIFLVIECFKKTNNIATVVLPVMAFILSGAEHCIADAFYLGSDVITWEGVLAVILVAIGNAFGSLMIRCLQTNLFEKTSK